VRGLLDRLHEHRERHRRRPLAARVGVALAGFLVVLGGILLIPLPGPGVLVIAVGLFLLALEFAWAERALHRAVDQLERTAEAATSASPARKALVIAALVVGVAAAVAIAIRWDVPGLPI
jgi:uncharacterized protein (TIGR02611 family)